MTEEPQLCKFPHNCAWPNCECWQQDEDRYEEPSWLGPAVIMGVIAGVVWVLIFKGLGWF